MKAVFRFGAAAGIWLAAQAAGSVQVQAQALDAFFKAQPFTILVGYPPGAAYDMYARLVSRHIGQYLPGKPTGPAARHRDFGTHPGTHQSSGPTPRPAAEPTADQPAQRLPA